MKSIIRDQLYTKHKVKYFENYPLQYFQKKIILVFQIQMFVSPQQDISLEGSVQNISRIWKNCLMSVYKNVKNPILK